MPTRVEVVGQGTIEFPDSMTDDQIQEVLRRDFSQSPTPATDTAAEDTPAGPPPETFGQKLSRWAQAPSPEWMQGAEAAIREPLQQANQLAQTPSPEWMQPAEKIIREPLPGAKEAALAAMRVTPVLDIPGAIADTADVVAPGSRLSQAARAVEDTTAENLSGFLSPGNIALGLISAGTSEAIPAVQVINRLVSAGFAIPQAKQTAQLYGQFTQETDPAKKLRLGIGLLEGGALTAILGKGALEGKGIPRAPVDEGAPLTEAQTAAATDLVSARQKVTDLLKEPDITQNDPRLVEAQNNLQAAQDAWLGSLQTAAQQEAATAPEAAAPADELGRPARRIIDVSTPVPAVEGASGGEPVPINWDNIQRRVITQAQLERMKPITGAVKVKGGEAISPWEQAAQALDQFQKEQAFDDEVRRQQVLEKEAQRATQEGEQQVGSEQQYPGVSQGPNVPEDVTQVREEGRGQAGGGGGTGTGPTEPTAETPVIDRQTYNQYRRMRAAGEVLMPEQHAAMKSYEQAAAKARYGLAKQQEALGALTQRVVNEIPLERLPQFQARVKDLLASGEDEAGALEKALREFTGEAVKAALETGQEKEKERATTGLAYPLGEAQPSGTYPLVEALQKTGTEQTAEQKAANAAVLAQLEAELGRPKTVKEQMAEDAATRAGALGPTAEELKAAEATQAAPPPRPPTPEEARYGPPQPPTAVQPGEFRQKGYTATEPKPPPVPAQPPPLPPPPLPVEKALIRDVGATNYFSAAAERKAVPGISRLVSENLAKNPRPATPQEFTHLNEHLIDLEKEQDRAINARNANPADVVARDRADRLNQEIIDQRDLIKRTRSLTAKEDLSTIHELDRQRMQLPRMRAEAQALANDGRPLETNPELAKLVEDTHKGLQEVDKNIAEAQAHQDFQQVLKDERTQARVEAARLEPKKPLLQNAYEAAMKRMQERFNEGGQAFSGVVPDFGLIRDQAIIGAYHIGRGLTKFADWSKAMAKDIGQRSQAYMEELFARSKQYHIEAAKALKQPSKLTPEEVKEMSKLGKTEKAIGELQAGRMPGPNRPPPLPVRSRAALDPFLVKQLAKKQQLIGEYNAALAKARWQKLPLAYRAGVRALGVGQEIQTMKSAFDISAVLRQGGILVAGHPVAAGRAMGALAKAAQWGKAGELGAREVMTEIENNPLNVEDNVLKRGKLELTNPFADEHGQLNTTAKEEAFKGVLAKKIPGVNWSDRTFHIFLNKLRAESYYGLVNQLEKWTGRKATDHELQVLGNYVNIATGRGATGGFIKSFEGLSKIMWSPRLFMSRLQYLGLQPLWSRAFREGGAAPQARALIAAEYAKSVSGLALALSLATMAGATIELDPRSTDFGKIKFGNTRFDLMAGLQQPFVLGNRLLMGSQKTSKGKIVPIRGKVPYGEPTGGDLLMRFARTKLPPAVGSVVDVSGGETITGQPTTATNEALSAFLPLSINDVYDALQADGVPQETAGVMLALMGVGVGTYSPVTTREKNLYRATMERRDRAVWHGDIPEAIRLTAKLKKGPY